MCGHPNRMECQIGGPWLGICMLICLLGYVLGLRFIVGVDTVILECVLPSVCCLLSLSMSLGVQQLVIEWLIT